MTPEPLSFFSWNLAMLERSDQAPPSWTQDHAQAAIRELALAIGPDLILFQELPGMVPYVETHAMIPANPVTHNGNLATLVTQPLMAREDPDHRVVQRTALLAEFRGLDLTVANVHLAPGRGGAQRRLEQMTAVQDAAETTHLLVVGDTNSRLDEADGFAELGLRGEKPPIPTWDSRGNRFRESVPEFSAYFTRYFASKGLIVDQVTVWDQDQAEHEGVRFQLSDHYALSGRVYAREPDSPAI